MANPSFTTEHLNIQGGTFNHTESGNIVHHHEANVTGFNLLTKHIATTALHNSNQVADPPKCHPGTRVAILDMLQGWAAASEHAYPIKWLHGSAGSGKTAIVRTLAELLAAKGHLLAAFFCFRSDPMRNSPQHIIATLASQIAVAVPLARPRIEQAVEQNPLIFSYSIFDQIQALIIDPLHFASKDAAFNPGSFPRAILIDGLDECGDSKQQHEVLESFGKMAKNLDLPVMILIASRPEQHIQSAFNLGSLNESSTRLALDSSFQPDADIRKYYTDKFHEIQATHPLRSHIPRGWPSSETIDILVKKASGQFIYASTTTTFSGSTRHNPVTRLEILLGDRPSLGLQPFQQLDFIYSTILQNINAGDLPIVLKLLGIILTPIIDASGDQRSIMTISRQGTYQTFSYIEGSEFRSPLFLEELLGLEKGEVQRLFLDLESILTVINDTTDIFIFHTSLSDFIFDKSRAGQFFVSKSNVFAQLAIHTIQYTCSSPSNSSHIRHFVDQLSPYLQNGTSDSNLQEFLVQFDIKALMGCRDADHDQEAAYGIRVLAPSFLGAVRFLEMPNAEDLYKVYHQQFTMIVGQILKEYLDSPPLQYLAIGAILSHNFLQTDKHKFPSTNIIISRSADYQKLYFEGFFNSISQPLSKEMIRWDKSAGLHFCASHQDRTLLAHFLFETLQLPDGDLFIQECCTNFAICLITPPSQMFHHHPFLAPQPGNIKENLCARHRHSHQNEFNAIFPKILQRSLVQPDLALLVTDALLKLDHSYLEVEILLALMSYQQRWSVQQMEKQVQEAKEKSQEMQQNLENLEEKIRRLHETRWLNGFGKNMQIWLLLGIIISTGCVYYFRAY